MFVCMLRVVEGDAALWLIGIGVDWCRTTRALPQSGRETTWWHSVLVDHWLSGVDNWSALVAVVAVAIAFAGYWIASDCVWNGSNSQLSKHL